MRDPAPGAVTPETAPRETATRAAGRAGVRPPLPPPHLSVVVPVWNGAERLPASLARLGSFLADRPFASELVLVDDCSEPRTARVLEATAREGERVTLLRNARNRGKGFSVCRGMLAARGAYRVFLDADLAYPPAEITKLVAALDGGADVAIACRVLPASRYVMSPTFFRYLYTRHVMSRAFNAVVRHTLLPGVLDSQAGLKGFTAAAAEGIFPAVTTPGFGFDVECLYVARVLGLRVAQVPVTFHYDDEPTTVHFARDAARMLRDIARVGWRGWRGRYAPRGGTPE